MEKKRARRMTQGVNPAIIRTLRKQYGWTQEELAEKWGKHPITVGRMERGQLVVTKLQDLYELAGVFAVAPGMLLGDATFSEMPDREEYELIERLPPEKKRVVFSVARSLVAA